MSILLDTRTVPEAERRDYWSEGISEHFFPARFAPAEATPFSGRVTGADIGSISVRTIRGGRHSIARTPRMIAASDPESILLCQVRTGSCRVEQGGRIARLAPGDLAAHDTSLPSLVEADDAFEMHVVGFPRWLIGGLADRIAPRTAQRVAASGELMANMAGPLLASVAKAAQDRILDDIEASRATEMLLSLLRVLFDRPLDDGLRPSGSAVLLTRMRDYALAHLSDPDLGPENLARAHFVSTRYVHRLFASSGIGVSAWIRERRLDAAVRELRAHRERPIASVAADCGFVDPAGFSRAVRRAYGFSPRELRARG